MVIIAQLFLGLFALLCILALINKIWPNPLLGESLKIVLNGMKEAYRGCGFCYTKPRPKPELYKWQTMDDTEVCADCLERSSWEAMDIADWMKHGLPGKPESETSCRENCRCELVLIEDPKLP